MKHLCVLALSSILLAGCNLASRADSTPSNAAGATQLVIPVAIRATETIAAPIPASAEPSPLSFGSSSQRVTTEPTLCVQPSGWVIYSIQSGETLANIALQTGSTIDALAGANCLGNINVINSGQVLYVPRLPSAPITTTSVQTVALSGCTARTTNTSTMLSWPQGTDAFVVGNPPAGTVLAVSSINFNGYVQVNFNNVQGWVEPYAVTLLGDCANDLPPQFVGCLVWVSSSDFELNVLTEPNGPPIVQFPEQSWIYAIGYRPMEPGESGRYGTEGWYKVHLAENIEGWIPAAAISFNGRIVGNCTSLAG